LKAALKQIEYKGLTSPSLAVSLGYY